MDRHCILDCTACVNNRVQFTPTTTQKIQPDNNSQKEIESYE